MAQALAGQQPGAELQGACGCVARSLAAAAAAAEAPVLDSCLQLL
jgi:hypothetical protein